ncbi:MAG: cation-translocating P-type ATPase [Bacteroidota bacterium]|nr:cation-translocating P-type ATPase [Bacteroidota bacterium]
MNSLQYPILNAHSFSTQEICNQLNTNTDKGLSDVEVKERQQSFGKNSIKEKKRKNLWLICLEQFANPMVYLLFAAVALSFFFKEWLDGFAILTVILINAIIGFLMEFQAERSMHALKKMTQVNAKIFRDNKLIEIPASEMVPGDIFFVDPGDMVLADARIFNLSQFQVDESALTGESMPVEKQDKILEVPTTLAERVNMLYKGTNVTNGNAKAIVTATGMETELGKIASMVQTAAPVITPLEKKLAQFSKNLIKITIGLVVLIFITGLLYGDSVIEMLKTSIALAVAAIPEGLPIVATLALAQGMLRLAKHNVIVKKLSAVETLGGTNVICTDKTGTLTQNKIEVSIISSAEGKSEINVDLNHRNIPSDAISRQWIYKISVLCNTAKLDLVNGEVKEVGDPLETALLKFVYSEGIDIETLRTKHPKIKEEPFSSETKIMATLHKAEENNMIVAKGGIDELLQRCTHYLENEKQVVMEEVQKKKWISEAENLAHSGLRVIATAFRETNEIPEKLSEQLVFAGLIGMLDPIRKEVSAAIQECKSAGINVIMITGDHPATAKNIGMKLGLIDSDNDNVLHGKDMMQSENLPAEEKQKWINTKIFARVSPKQKLDLVTVLQENHFVVGMTGDGVNDAPALKKADIGIAMGMRGTQVAQEVANMILKDDSFSSIVVGIKQGRIIFENIRKFVVFLLSCNISELLIVSIASVFNLHFSLFALQILYINLVTDVMPALALGVSKGSDDVMKLPPRNANEPILDRKRWISVFVYSFVIMACTMSAVFFSHYLIHSYESWNTELCNNILFITLILCQLFHVFNMNTDNSKSFFKTDVFRNKYVWYALLLCLVILILAYLIPPVAKVLSLHSPSWADLGIMLGFSLLSLLIIQILKRTKIIL